jgi:uncharacterized membrane protein
MKYRLVLAVSLGVSVLLGAYFFPRLPDVMAIHWGPSGEADGFGSKWFNLLMTPIVLAVMWIIFEVTLRATKPEAKPSVERSFVYVGLGVAVLMVGMQAFILWNPVGVSSANGSQAFKDGFGVLISFMLLVLGLAVRNIEPNPWSGIRVPWTLNNAEVWRISHERAYRLWVVSGIIGMVLSLIGVPFWVPLMLMIGVCLYPIFDSYLVHRRVTKGVPSP